MGEKKVTTIVLYQHSKTPEETKEIRNVAQNVINVAGFYTFFLFLFFTFFCEGRLCLFRMNSIQSFLPQT